jgi:truncated hemoglobin YjbI
MEHKVTFKTKDGTLKEQRFDDFNQFADTIETLATDYYAGMRTDIDVETIYDDMIKKERVTENGRLDPEAEFIRD